MRNVVIACIVLFAMAGTAFSETKEPPKKLSVDLGGGVKMELVLIPAGEFKMGSAESAEDTAAFFNRPSSGPMTQIEPRIFRIKS